MHMITVLLFLVSKIQVAKKPAKQRMKLVLARKATN